jgi:RNA polymerase sigma factor (sigma-70 family)
VLSETVTNVEFAAFYAMERTALVRFVMYLGCADADTAEDITHAAFTRAFAAWATIRFPKAWLRKVAQNEYFRYCQAAARETPLDAASAEAARRVLSAAMALDHQAGLREDLATAISALPPKQRQVMAWHWDGFSDAEIAIQLGDSEVAVRKNRSRALKNLRRYLDETGREAI